MVTGRIKFNTTNDVVAFVNAVSKYTFDVDVYKGAMMLDGKSLQGLFTVGLSQELECVIHTSLADAHDIISDISKFALDDFK